MCGVVVLRRGYGERRSVVVAACSPSELLLRLLLLVLLLVAVRLPTTPRKGTRTTARAGVTAEVPAEEAGSVGQRCSALCVFSFGAAALAAARGGIRVAEGRAGDVAPPRRTSGRQLLPGEP